MEFTKSLAIETWIMYALGVIFIAGRIISRRIQEGSLKRLWAEEYIMLLLLVTFTLDCWSINEVALNGSNFMSPEAAANLSPQEVRQAIYGSKMTLVTEMLTLTTQWGLKGVLCLMYHRLTFRLVRLHLAVKCIAGFCLFSYCIIVALFLGLWCRPFNQYWAVPVEISQCASYYHHMIFATAWNISADIALLVIPFLMIPKTQLPLRRKILIICVLGLGVFNILTAVLNRYYNFAHPDSVQYLIWYVGEVGTAVYVVNVPACWPLIRKLLPKWLGATSDGSGGATNHSSFRLRSAFQRPAPHNPPAMVSESEENLAMHTVSLHRSEEGGMEVNEFVQSQYRAKAIGEGDHRRSTPGIVKTVEFKVSKATL